MTPDQHKALEILLDAQGLLDTDTQLMPLVRFVLFGSTEQEKQAFAMISDCGRKIVAYCSECGDTFMQFDSDNHGIEESIVFMVAQIDRCPNCGAKFKK